MGLLGSITKQSNNHKGVCLDRVRPFFVDKFCANVLYERCLCANFV